MNNLTVGNIAVEAQRAVRLGSSAYCDRVLGLIDRIVAEGVLSRGGVKEMLRTREILCEHFYAGGSEYIDFALKNLMGFAFLERKRVL